jgi:23S rRNA pseudouridine2604 synthase
MAWTCTYNEPEPQRINRWLGQSGVCSRREAEAFISQGLVSVDGETVTDAGHKILPGQTLTLASDAESALSAQMSIVFHKPIGIVSAQPEADQIPAIRLITREAHWDIEGEEIDLDLVVPDLEASLPALGRLDKDSRGLLILSQDGVLAKAIIGPDSVLTKQYEVTVEGEINERKLNLLRRGLALDGRQLRQAKVQVIGDQRLRFVLSEGRNRQIRRMCELVDLEVTDLLRTRIGTLDLGDLPEGMWRHMTHQEREALVEG